MTVPDSTEGNLLDFYGIGEDFAKKKSLETFAALVSCKNMAEAVDSVFPDLTDEQRYRVCLIIRISSRLGVWKEL